MTTAKVLALAVGYGIFSFSILGFGDLHGHGCEPLCNGVNSPSRYHRGLRRGQ